MVNQNLAEYILGQYESRNFDKHEIKRTIQSAYSQRQNFGTKYYEDEDKVNQYQTQIKREFQKEIRLQLQDSNMEDHTIDSVINHIEEEQSNHKFWTKNDKGTIKIVHILFKHFLEENGFYKFNPQGSKNYVFVRVTNNLIDHTSEKEIKDFILEYLQDMDDLSIYNYFAENTQGISEKSFYSTIIDRCLFY